MNRAITFSALGLAALVSIAAQAAYPAVGDSCMPVRIVVEREDDARVSREEKTMCLASTRFAEDAISWGDIGRAPLWPFRAGEAAAKVSIADQAIQPIVVSFERSCPAEGNAAHCIECSIGIKGSITGSNAPGLRGATITGQGMALVCGRDGRARAAHISLQRMVRPALWEAQSPDERRMSSVAVAWSEVP